MAIRLSRLRWVRDVGENRRSALQRLARQPIGCGEEGGRAKRMNGGDGAMQRDRERERERSKARSLDLAHCREGAVLAVGMPLCSVA
jgi:hypothetical protein